MAVAGYMAAPTVKQPKQTIQRVQQNPTMGRETGGFLPPNRMTNMQNPTMGRGYSQQNPTFGGNKTGPTPPPPNTMTNGYNPPGQSQGQYATTPGNWQPNIPMPSNMGGGNQGVNAGYVGGQNDFYKQIGDRMWNLNDFSDDSDGSLARYISSVLPVAQFGQNNYQYASDFNEAQRRWNQEFGAGRQDNYFNQQMGTRQQQMAEWQAQQAANQWGQQFGHTQQMDKAGLDLQRLGLDNQFRMGMDQNQASRDVAGTYAGAQNYGADQQRIANMYGADQQLAGARGYADAQRYQADQSLAGYRYQSDAQERMNQAQMANNLSTAAMAAYGRAQQPAAKWARGWG